MSSIVIFGAGGHAKVILDIAEHAGRKIIGIFDDNPNAAKTLFSYPVLGGSKELLQFVKENANTSVVIAVGNNAARKKIAEDFAKANVRFATLVHPSAVVSKHSQIGEGSVVMAGAVVNCSTSIGKHVIVNTSCSIDHDCSTGDYVHIAPGTTLCGTVKVGEGTLVGVGAQIAPNTSVGAWSIVGAGATVVSQVASHVTVVGTPARPIGK